MAFLRTITVRGKKYYILVNNTWVNGKVKQKLIMYLGKPENIAKKLHNYSNLKKNVDEEIKEMSVKGYGDVTALFSTIQELNLIHILNRHTFKGGGIDAGRLASIIAINHCIDSCSKRKVNQWYRHTYLPELTGVQELTKDSLCRVLDYFTDDVILNIQKDIVKQLEKLFKLNKDYLLYDMTSTYFEGNQCTLAEFGYSRDKRPDRKQVNFALVVSRIGKFPLMHRVFKGNVRDITTVTETANTLKTELDVNTCMLILDRGMISEGNVKVLDKQRYGFIAGLAKHKLAKELILSAKDYREYKEWLLSETIRELHGKQREFVVCYSKEKAEYDKRVREEKLSKVEKKLDKLLNSIGKGIYKNRDRVVMKIGEITKGFRKYLDINHPRDSLEFSYSRNKNALELAEKLDGKHVLISTDLNMSAEDIVLAYRDKDKAEKAFRNLKTFIKIRPIRHWLDQRVKAHIFLCVLAYLLESVLEYKVRKMGYSMTGWELLERLHDVKLVSYKKGSIVINKLVGVSKDIETVFKDLRLNSFIKCEI
jgi:transposase